MHAPYRPQRPAFGFLALLGAMTAFGALSIDLYLPAVPTMGRALGATPAATQQTIAAFIAGVAIGQLVYGPVSDRAGRLRPLFAGCALYIAASVACALADSVEVLVAARFAQGLGACASIVIARAIVRDRYDTLESARVFSWLTLVFGLAPVLAPLAGSALLATLGWRAIFWSLVVFGMAVTAVAALRLPETRGVAARERASEEGTLAVGARLLRDRRLLGYLLAGSLSSASLFAYVSSSATLFIDDFGLSPFNYSLLFGVNALAMVGAAQLNRALLARFTPDRIAGWALVGALIVSVAFAAAAAAGAAGMWETFAATFLMMAMFGLSVGNLTAGALAIDPEHSGSISALTGAAGFGVGAVVAGAASAAHDGTAWPLALTLVISYGLALPAFLLRRAR